MRRMKDDERAVLRCLASDNKATRTLANVTINRLMTIDSTLRYHGLVDMFGRITKRGRHVASRLPPIAEPEPAPIESSGVVDFTDEKDLD